AWKGPLPESVTIRRSSQGTVSHFFDAPHRMAGRPRTVMERIGQKLFEIPAESFFQVNSEMMAALLGHASSLVAEGSVIVDSYCGAGVIGLAALRPGQSLIGIDSDKASIACAVNNVRITGAEQAEFIARTAESALGDVLKSQAGKPVTLILDPPRDGCAPAVLKAIGKSRPETIVYISCNPPTLARDVKSLLGAYTLTETVFVDMFPQTKHSEVIVRLIRK
ncbi:MAG TPA: RsmD family RNA methyltransferase, partial [bacterium]|nr:RsmD family RNA methyltransferase [bacterium]